MSRAPGRSSDKPSNRLAPIQINWDLLGSGRLESLYKFAHILFAGAASNGILQTLLDQEHGMNRLFLNLPQGERLQIGEALKGIVVELSLVISEEGTGNLLSVPIRLEPSAIMQRAILGKGPPPALERQLAEMKKVIAGYIKEELQRKMKEVLEGFFKGEVVKARLKGAVQKLMGLGVITRKGELAPEVMISDLIYGKYKDLFAQITTEEIVQEGLLIQQTLAHLYQWSEIGEEEWGREAREELDLIGKTLQTLKGQ